MQKAELHMQQLYCVLNIKTTILKIVFSIFFVAMIASSCTTAKNEDAIQPTSTIESTPIVFSQQTGIPATNSIMTATKYPQMTATSMAAQSDDSILDILLPNCYGEEFSPDRKWAIGYCGYDETWIIRVDQTAKWTMAYGEYYGKKFNSGEGLITPEYWTTDGKYLYSAWGIWANLFCKCMGINTFGLGKWSVFRNIETPTTRLLFIFAGWREFSIHLST